MGDGIYFARAVTDKIDRKHLNRWVKDKICAEGMDYLKELAEVLLPGGVGTTQIKIITTNHPGDIKSCFTDLVNEWTQREIDATWQKLIDAVKDTNKLALANDIKNSLLKTRPVVVPTQQEEGNQQVVLATQLQQAEQMNQPSVEGMHMAFSVDHVSKERYNQPTLVVTIVYRQRN